MGAYNIVGASTLVAGQPEDVSQVLANFQAIAGVINGGIDNTNIAVNANIDASKLNIPATSGVPTGVPIPFCGNVIPTGFLECDGSPVSRTQYSNLFNTIGTTWGAGDGSTTFNVPDFRGRSLFGFAASGGHADVSAMGATEGTPLASRRPRHGHTNGVTASHTLTLPPHVHPIERTNVAAVSTAVDASAIYALQADTGTTYITSQQPSTFPAITGGVQIGGTVGVAGPLDSSGYAVVHWMIKT
jgi:microcystin-dependent protein